MTLQRDHADIGGGSRVAADLVGEIGRQAVVPGEVIEAAEEEDQGLERVVVQIPGRDGAAAPPGPP